MNNDLDNEIRKLKEKRERSSIIILCIWGALMLALLIFLMLPDTDWSDWESIGIGIAAVIFTPIVILLIVYCSYSNKIGIASRKMESEYMTERARIINRVNKMIQKNINYIAEFEKKHPDAWHNKERVQEDGDMRTLYYTGFELCLIPYIRTDNCEDQVAKPNELFCCLDKAKYLDETEARLVRDNAYGDLFSLAIKLSDIKYFHVVGDMYTTTNISGGGGGGYSLSGAIVGGMVAGDVGAIIGSRQPVNPIVSSTKVHDNRTVELLFHRNGYVDTLKLNYEILDYLKRWIPEKEYSYVLAEKDEDDIYDDDIYDDESCEESYEDNPSDVKSRLIKLNELKEDGLITKAEYAAKKKEILNSV